MWDIKEFEKFYYNVPITLYYLNHVGYKVLRSLTIFIEMIISYYLNHVGYKGSSSYAYPTPSRVSIIWTMWDIKKENAGRGKGKGKVTII